MTKLRLPADIRRIFDETIECLIRRNEQWAQLESHVDDIEALRKDLSEKHRVLNILNRNSDDKITGFKQKLISEIYALEQRTAPLSSMQPVNVWGFGRLYDDGYILDLPLKWQNLGNGLVKLLYDHVHSSLGDVGSEKVGECEIDTYTELYMKNRAEEEILYGLGAMTKPSGIPEELKKAKIVLKIFTSHVSPTQKLETGLAEGYINPCYVYSDSEKTIKTVSETRQKGKTKGTKSMRDVFIEYMMEHDEMRPSDGEKLGFSYDSSATALSKLYNDGIASRPEKGLYTLKATPHRKSSEVTNKKTGRKKRYSAKGAIRNYLKEHGSITSSQIRKLANESGYKPRTLVNAFSRMKKEKNIIESDGCYVFAPPKTIRVLQIYSGNMNNVFSCQDIMKASGCSDGLPSILAKQGYIERTEKGKYRITEMGMKMLSKYGQNISGK